MSSLPIPRPLTDHERAALCAIGAENRRHILGDDHIRLATDNDDITIEGDHEQARLIINGHEWACVTRERLALIAMDLPE